jgi:hypothetical protein
MLYAECDIFLRSIELPKQQVSEYKTKIAYLIFLSPYFLFCQPPTELSRSRDPSLESLGVQFPLKVLVADDSTVNLQVSPSRIPSFPFILRPYSSPSFPTVSLVRHFFPSSPFLAISFPRRHFFPSSPYLSLVAVSFPRRRIFPSSPYLSLVRQFFLVAISLIFKIYLFIYNLFIIIILLHH